MSENWFRWHVGTATDPKWRAVAARCGEKVATVLAVWACVLERASSQGGRIDGWNDEDVGAGLDLDAATVAGIIGAMQGKTLDGLAVARWGVRQTKRPDDLSTDRVRAFRERQREAAASDDADRSTDAEATPAVEMERDETHETQAKHDLTHGNSRGEERRLERKISPPLKGPPPSETDGTADAVLTDEPPPKSKRGTRLPRDWTPTESDRAFAKQRGFNEEHIDGLRDEFRDYWCGVAGAKGLKVDWDGTWRNRIRDRAGGGSVSSAGADRRGSRPGSNSFVEAAARAAARDR